jgi:hypothetical protein
MRKLQQFSVADWIALRPARDGLRQLRNDVLLSSYVRSAAPGLEAFLKANEHVADAALLIVIAFEQPWALDWLLASAARNATGFTVLVFDNSRTPQARAAIRQVCERRGTACLALPPYRTRHPNRSHGMAMAWVHENVVRALRPRSFGFIDHDLIPLSPSTLPHECLRSQPVYGLLNPGSHEYWNLWAGYCFFRYEASAAARLNFLYDFSRGLDTGGRNWKTLYQGLDFGQLYFARREVLEVRLPTLPQPYPVECIDGAWIHIGGIGYSDKLKRNFEFFSALRAAVDAGEDWQALRQQARPISEEHWR